MPTNSFRKCNSLQKDPRFSQVACSSFCCKPQVTDQMCVRKTFLSTRLINSWVFIYISFLFAVKSLQHPMSYCLSRQHSPHPLPPFSISVSILFGSWVYFKTYWAEIWLGFPLLHPLLSSPLPSSAATATFISIILPPLKPQQQ